MNNGHYIACKTPDIKISTHYGQFKCLRGNRNVLDNRVNKIINSINSVGLIPCPIVVNERFEVIDGQGRLEAVKRLGLPVYYMVIDGLGIEHCVAMNINQTNWTVLDYVYSYSDQGNDDYIRLAKILEKHKNLGFRVVSCAVCDSIISTDTVKNGRMKCPAARTEIANELLSWIEENVVPIKEKVGGRFDTLCYAVLFCLEHTTADWQRLARVLKDNAYDFMPPANTVAAMKEIERIYNAYLKSNKIYFSSEYDKYLTENRCFYDNRWSVSAREKKRAVGGTA